MAAAESKGGTSRSLAVIACVAVAFIAYQAQLESTTAHKHLYASNSSQDDWTARLHTDGFALLPGLLTNDEIAQLREASVRYCYTEDKALPHQGGFTVPDFLSLPEFSSVQWIKTHSGIEGALKQVMGEQFTFCAHNDIGCDRISFWHKDRLNGAVRKYQVQDPWGKVGDEVHEIYKVLIYLEDHHEDDHGLKLIPGSHLRQAITTPGDEIVQLHPREGDVLFFDQRISHQGQTSFSKHKDGYRILMSLGFGKKNIFTEEFANGTTVRQGTQQKQMLDGPKSGTTGREWTKMVDRTYWQVIAFLQRLAPETFEKIKQTKIGGGY